METWRLVTENDNYEVSNMGHVANVNTGNVLTPGHNVYGYEQIVMWNGRDRRTAPVHRLVAHAFIGERPIGYQIDHMNGNKLDNRVCNLEYVTPSENILRSFKLGKKRPVGECNGRTKLTDDDVMSIYELSTSRAMSQVDIAKAYNIGKRTVRHIVHGDTWSHITGVKPRQSGSVKLM